jgi:sphinganine-1-phosphate aldolase
MSMFDRASGPVSRTSLPVNGMTREEIREALAAGRREDVDWESGVLQSHVYAVGHDVEEVGLEAYAAYYATNALLLKFFPSLSRMEYEVLAMTANLLHAPGPFGIMTTGGTESNMLAVLSARERARAEKPQISRPEIVLSQSAHPSFNKACHLFGLSARRVPLTAELDTDVHGMAAAITDQTVLVVGSAPTFSHGVVDQIPELSAIASDRDILFHVDSCVGGFVLPFLEKIGEPVPSWDFRVPGVTSISADLHKHGYSVKGASVITFRTERLRDFCQFSFSDWPYGLYATHTIGGSRAGGTVAAAWAVMNFLGEEGYCRITAKSMEITRAFMDGIVEIPGLEIWAKPVMNHFGYGSRTFDTYAIADGMEQRGWVVGRQQSPPAINMHVFPVHEPIVSRYLQDLDDVVRLVAKGEITRSDKRATYN